MLPLQKYAFITFLSNPNLAKVDNLRKVHKVQGSTNFESYGHFVAHINIFRFSHAGFDRHEVATIFGKQGSLEFGLADLNAYRNHSPTICH